MFSHKFKQSGGLYIQPLLVTVAPGTVGLSIVVGLGVECSGETLMFKSSGEFTVGVVSGTNIRSLLFLLTLPVGVCTVYERGATWERTVAFLWNSGTHTVSPCCSGGNSQVL